MLRYPKITVITKARYCEGETFAEFSLDDKDHDWDALYKRAPSDRISARVERSADNGISGDERRLGGIRDRVPLVAKLCASVSNREMRILARDENLDIMDEHLTEGDRDRYDRHPAIRNIRMRLGGPRQASYKWVIERNEDPQGERIAR